MDLIDLLKKMEDINQRGKEFFGDDSFLSYLISDLWEIILDDYGIPKDNTVELAEKYGSMEKASEDKDFSCRDYWTDLLYDFGKGEITKEKLVEELKNWDENLKTNEI